MKIAVAGEGAIGRSHLDAIAMLVGGDPDATRSLAENRRIPTYTVNFEDALSDPAIEAMILCTPTPLHAAQAEAVLLKGKHCLVEIPMATSLADSKSLSAAAAASGRIAMVAHTRRFNRGHRWLHEQFACDELHLQHLVVETFFFRRTNTNIHGEPRSWTDDLLWHHACHSIDLFQYQTDHVAVGATALGGPVSKTLGIPMDLSIGLSAPNGALLSLSLSFNNEGPGGSTFRYICNEGTFIARYDELTDGSGTSIDLTSTGPIGGTETQDREFFTAIVSGREPNSSVAQSMPAMETLDRLQTMLRYSSKKS